MCYRIRIKWKFCTTYYVLKYQYLQSTRSNRVRKGFICKSEVLDSNSHDIIVVWACVRNHFLCSLNYRLYSKKKYQYLRLDEYLLHDKESPLKVLLWKLGAMKWTFRLLLNQRTGMWPLQLVLHERQFLSDWNVTPWNKGVWGWRWVASHI